MERFLDFFKHLREILSLDYRALFILACIGWVAFLIPQSAWESLGLRTLGSVSRPWSFGIALVFTVWLVAAGAYDLGTKGMGWFSDRQEADRQARRRETVLLATSRVEREVLARYVKEDTTTLAWDVRDGVVNGLISKGVLVRASTASNPMSYSFDTNVQPWAWKYIKEHPSILDGVKPVKMGRHELG